MESYNELAYYYDLLMDDVDYEQWADYITGIFEYYSVKPHKILDTACGTGNVTIPLARRGYEMWGMDLSEDMLSIAQNKADKQKQKIRFLNQDMSDMQINDKFDCITCMCDGVNYIIEEKALRKFFANVHQKLNENGIFVFDISSRYKLSTILGNNTLYQENNNINYIWNNSYDEENEMLEMNLIFFVPEKDQLYKKFEEFHTQKAYDVQYLKKVLVETGFKNISLYGEFSFEMPLDESERVFIAASK